MIRSFLIATALLLLIGTSRTGAQPDRTLPRSQAWQNLLDRSPFHFDQTQANLSRSLAGFNAQCQIQMVYNPADGLHLSITFVRERKKILALDGQPYSVFITSGDVLYFAHYSPIASGCAVAAYDLATGRSLWKTRLSGIGPVLHTEYENAVSIAFSDGNGIENNREAAVSIAGHETYGDYVEVLDSHTGAVLAHKVYRLSNENQGK